MKNKKVIIIISIFIILLSSIFILFNKKEADNIKFKNEYKDVSKNNKFIYKTDEEIIKILKHGTGVVFLGFPECKWCQKYVTFIDEVSKTTEIEKINYLNIKNIREKNTKEYQEIVSILDSYLSYDEDGNKRIYVPCVISVLDGKIVGFDDESSLDTKGFDNPDDYWKNNDQEALINKLETMFKETKKNICYSDCNS